MRKWIPAVLIAGCYLFSLWVYPGLPDRVAPGWDALFPWIPASDEDAAPRAFAAFAIPTVALILWLAFRAAASRTAVKRFGSTFDIVVALVVGFVVLLHLVTLGTVIGWPGWTARAFTGLIGVGIMVLGNVMPRTRPNWVAGLRTKRTVSDPDAWRLTHRYFGAFLMVTGLVVVAMSLVSAPYALLGAGVGFLLSAILATALGRGRGAVQGERPPIAGLVIMVLLAGGSP